MILLFLFAGVGKLNAQSSVSVKSPDGRIKFMFTSVAGRPEYSVSYQSKNLISHSTLGLSFINSDFFGKDIKIGRVTAVDGMEDYTLLQGKASKVHERYKEAEIAMIYLRVRVFNDAVAFRYEIPAQKTWDNYSLTEEHTNFNLSGNPMSRIAFLENFTTSHEHRYNVMPLSAIENDTLMDMPALFEFPGNIFMGITEANLVDYAGMSLIKRNGILTSQLSPLPGQSEMKGKGNASSSHTMEGYDDQ